MAAQILAAVPGLDECQQQSLGDPGICIAIVDSRADLSHPSFAGADIREVMPTWLRSVMGNGGASHGTHIASVIFGQPGGPVAGIAPRCRGIIIPVYGEREDGQLRSCSQADLGRAISLALGEGANLINISGGELIEPGDVDPMLEKIVHSCEQQDVLIVAATGNEGCECLHMPAFLQSVLAVGASNLAGQPMSFSNWDESLASHGVLAPGEQIPGAVPGNGVMSQSGTSFACPIVTGAAALMLSLQKQHGRKPSPKQVREAIVSSAIPCNEAERRQQGLCERMLGGRLNVAEACRTLFGDGATSEPGSEPGKLLPANSIRAPPQAAAVARHWHDGTGSEISENEGTIMTSGHIQVQPQGSAAEHQGLAAGAWPAAGIAPAAGPALAAAHAMAMPEQAAAAGVQPQGCSCGGAQASQDASPPPPHQQMVPSHVQQMVPSVQQMVPPYAQQVVPSHLQQMVPSQLMMPSHADVLPAQHPVPATQPARLVQVSYGSIPSLSPAQRAMMAVSPAATVAQPIAMPAIRGIAPSQVSPGCPCPMPNDFISADNSQLVYAIGTIGYDFITDARRDYFVQQLRDMSDHDDYINQFKSTLGLQTDVIYYPEDHRAMAAYLFQNYLFRVDPGRFGLHVEDTGSLVWVLFQENQPQYALRPLHTFAGPVLVQLANFLFNQARPEHVLDTDGKPTGEPNPERADRVSIAGRILGDITLYNGSRVPLLDVSLRALYQWTVKLLLSDLAEEHPEFNDENSALRNSLQNFLERIYYEVRNLGQAPSDRAINYMTTNIFQAKDVFKNAVAKGFELDSIFAEKSPICRPKSDCWDVVMRFFDPAHRLERAIDEYRLTVDVNDVSPVSIGTTRHWARFA